MIRAVILGPNSDELSEGIGSTFKEAFNEALADLHGVSLDMFFEGLTTVEYWIHEYR